MSGLTIEKIGPVYEEVKNLGDEIRKLKEEKADPVLIKEKIARMLEKKKLLDQDTSGKYVVKFPKGTRDFGPRAAAIRDEVLRTISNTFLTHCAQKLDTPVYELKEVLLGKYGEEGGKLIFDLSEQNGRCLSLRYDLTVPFARYLAINSIKHMKRYHIGKVYRRDQPVMTRGRYREFYQCDFDIAGEAAVSMEPEAECLKITDEILSKLGLGDFEIKLNHRGLLEGMFAVCGIGTDSFKTVCSSIDKLDKVPWEEVKTELINEKHVDPEAVSKLEGMVRIREQNSELSNAQLLEHFEKDEELSKNTRIQKAVADLHSLLCQCTTMGIEKRVAFEPALARGLDYYTDAIFETVYKDFSIGFGESSSEGEKEGKTHVGTVAAGGRYDNLVEIFSATREHVPCVGVSFGVERLFSIMELKARVEDSTVRTCATDVYVASAQKNLLDKRLEICRELWDNHIRAEMPYKANPKMLNQLQYCEERFIPLVVIIGQREIEEGVIKIRDVVSRKEQDIPRSDFKKELKLRLRSGGPGSEFHSSILKERIVEIITESFKRHGAEALDTPVFELSNVLLGKYGAKNEEHFVNLKDQGGEMATMRYDLTVPFARYLSMNKVQNMKRYHIGKVYRQTENGTSEISQCDFDIAGYYDAMLPDAECVRVVVEVLSQLILQNFEIRVNHCSLLEGLVSFCEVETRQLNSVLSCLRKLNSVSWETISSKLSHEAKLSSENITKLQRFLILQKGDVKTTNTEVLELFEKDPELSKKTNVKNAISDLRLLLRYCELLGANEQIVIDPSLTPWFDYYTGIIFDVTVKAYDESGDKSVILPTIVAKGGRYDNLVGNFLPKKQRVPCVGLSFTTEALERVILAKEGKTSQCLVGIEVLVASAEENLVSERQRLLCSLWENGIKAEMCSFLDLLNDELGYCEQNSIPFLLEISEKGLVKLKDLKKNSEEVFSCDNLLPELVKRLRTQ